MQSNSSSDEESICGGGKATSPKSHSSLLSPLRCGCLEILGRIRKELNVELPMLQRRWHIMALCILMQYVHGIFTQLAHSMHRPQLQPLHDVGFDLIPELGPNYHWLSELIFGLMFTLFILWTFSPFFMQHRTFYTVTIWYRLLTIIISCQALRVLSFSFTQLPGPGYHCRSSSVTAIRPWPKHWTGHVILDLSTTVSKCCGDLLFSSHTTFMLSGLLTYSEYGTCNIKKMASWILGVLFTLLISASRKHYTVDLIVAWYTVPLVFYAWQRRWAIQSSASSSELHRSLQRDEQRPSSPVSMDVESACWEGTGLSQEACRQKVVKNWHKGVDHCTENRTIRTIGRERKGSLASLRGSSVTEHVSVEGIRKSFSYNKYNK